MDKMLELFIKDGLPQSNLGTLELFAEQWLLSKAPDKDIVLPYILDNKLKLYEQEY